MSANHFHDDSGLKYRSDAEAIEFKRKLYNYSLQNRMLTNIGKLSPARSDSDNSFEENVEPLQKKQKYSHSTVPYF